MNLPTEMEIRIFLLGKLVGENHSVGGRLQ